jgi:hypothetical protein
MHERDPQFSIHHDRDRLKRIELKALVGPNAGLAEIAINELSDPRVAARPNKWLWFPKIPSNRIRA